MCSNESIVKFNSFKDSERSTNRSDKMKLSAASIIGLASSSSAFIATSNQLKQPYNTQLFERKPFITGNWKLNPKTKDEAIELATEIASTITLESPEVALFVPFPFIECVQKAVGDKISVGAEMCTPETNGDHTINS